MSIKKTFVSKVLKLTKVRKRKKKLVQYRILMKAMQMMKARTSPTKNKCHEIMNKRVMRELGTILKKSAKL